MAGLQNQNLSFAELYKEAERSMPLLQAEGDKIVADLKTRYPGLFDDVKFEMGPLKTLERSQDKVNGDYKGDHTQITDLARGRLVIDKPEQVETLRQYFKEQREGFKVEVLKDRFAKPSDTNFRDINMQVRLGNGHVVEMRVEQKDILEAAKKTHDPYEEVQKMDRAAEKEGRMLTPDEATRRQTIMDSIRDAHGAAAQQAGVDRLLSDEGRAKMQAQEAERITPRDSTNSRQSTGSKIEHGAGKTAGVAGIAVDAASGNYASAAAGVAAEAANSEKFWDTAAKLGSAAKNIAKRLPVIGAAVTAGAVAVEVGKYVINGEGSKAAAAAAAGGAEIAGNVVGFGAGDAAREAVRETTIAIGGKKFEDVEKSGLRQLGEKTAELVSKFNSKSPGTPAQIAEMQANTLNKAGLNSIEKDGKKVDVSTILRDPNQRTVFIAELERAAKAAQNPEIKSNLETMASASKDFVEMEDRRTKLLAASNEPQMAQHQASLSRPSNASALNM